MRLVPFPFSPSVLLVAAVGLASCDQTSQPAAAAAEDPKAWSSDGAGGGARIAYVNLDSLVVKYDYLVEQTEVLQKQEAEANASLQQKGRAFQAEVQKFQQDAQAGNLTQKKAQSEQERLGRKEQELTLERDQVTQGLVSENQRLQFELQSALKREVANIQAAEGYDYVLSYGAGSNLLAVNDAYEITDLVIEKLNAAGPPTIDSTLVQ